MKILFDLTVFQTGDKKRGIGRYAKNFLNEFLKSNKDHDVHFLTTKMYPTPDLSPILGGQCSSFLAENDKLLHEFVNEVGMDKIHCYTGIPFIYSEDNKKTRQFFKDNQRQKKIFVESIAPDLYFNFHLNTGWMEPAVNFFEKGSNKSFKTASICYDFIPNDYPKFFLTSKLRKKFQSICNEALFESDYILSISEYSKNRAIELGCSADKITNIGTGMASELNYLQAVDKTPKKFKKLNKKFILSVGVFEWRKNFEIILKSVTGLSRAEKKSLEVVFVSGASNPSTLEFEIKYKKLAKRAGIKLHCFYEVSNEELTYLYKNCFLFIFPSFAEGFGLPVLEAIQLNSLALCSNTSATPEIINNDENYTFNPKDKRDLNDKISKFLKLRNDDLIKHKNIQKKYTSKYTYSNVVKKAFSAIKNTDSAYPNKDNFSENLNPIELTSNFNPKSHEHLSKLVNSLSKNFPIRKKYILLDVSIISINDAKSGIQRVVRNLCAEFLNRQYDEYEIKFVSCQGTHFLIRNDFERKINANLADFDISKLGEMPNEIYEPIKNDIFVGLDLNHFLYREHIALLSNMYSEGVRIFPIVYDILPITKEEYFDENIHKIHKMYFESAIMFGNIISMSKTTSDDFKKLSEKVGNINFKKTNAYHCLLGGAGESGLFNKKVDKKVSKDIKQQIFKHCHIVVGTLEPRKGHKDIIDAFEEAWKKGSDEKLLIIGKIGWKIDKTLKKIYKSKFYNTKLFFLEFVSDPELNFLYKNSKSLIIGSYGEGLGLPILEANACDLPIICRDIAVFKELAGNQAFYFKNSSELANIILDGDFHSKDLDLKHITWSSSVDEIEKIIFGKKNPDFIIHPANKLIKKGNYLDQIAYNKQAIKVRKPLIAAPTLNQNYFQITEGKYTLKLDLELFSDIKIHLKILSNLAQHTMLSEILTIKKWNKNISRDFEIYSNLEQNMEIQIFELDTKNKYNLNGYEVIKND